MEKKNINKWLYWLLFAIAVIVFYKLIDNFGEITGWIKKLLGILTPYGAGILIAYIFYVPCRKFESIYSKVKKIKFINKKARPLSILTVYVIVIVLIGILMNFIMPPIIQSVIDLTNNLSGYYDKAIEQVNELPDDSFWKTEVISKAIDELNNIDLK